jgi:hypothetical protein
MILINNNPLRTAKLKEQGGFISRSVLVIIAFSIVLLASVGIAIYFYLRYQQTQDQLTKSTQSNEQAALLSDVGKLIVLPTGEQPSIATVSDISKLKGQAFFAHARNGDKALIYSKAQEAILYDPLANKIVAVGPISVTQTTPAPSQKAHSEMPSIRVAVDNGTAIVGHASSVAKELEDKFPSVTVVSKADTQKSYTSTIVIDLTGKNATQAASLAKEFKATVSTLPQGEIKPANADVLIILGK